ncbi:MAG: MltA domain-containing protein [Pseudomonadota bacterium]
MPDWKPVSFETLEGWQQDDHLAAFSCFRMSARAFEEKAYVSRQAVQTPDGLIETARKSLALDISQMNNAKAKQFFEENFQPFSSQGKQGFVTAYFEPEVEASRVPTPEFSYPLYRRPEDLVKLDADNRPDDFSGELEYARQTEDGLVEYFDRGQIDSGALKDHALELFWLKSAIEGFYIHVQGSARLLLTDGSSARVSYAGKTGHPYTSIGKLLVDRGVMPLEQANMVNIRAWLEEDNERALGILHENRSFIFFTEVEGHEPEFGPIAAAGVQLTPGRSLAVDKNLHAYGTPVWISTEKPLPSDTKPFRRLMIAQDTGSAIVGPKRGDIFIGSGQEAGIIAGSVRHDTEFIIFHPRER